MQDQRIPDEDMQDGFTEEQIDNIVLGFMLCGDSWPWTVDEIARELGGEGEAIDAVARLTRTGLLHQAGSSCSRRAPLAGRTNYRSAPSDRTASIGLGCAAPFGQGAALSVDVGWLSGHDGAGAQAGCLVIPCRSAGRADSRMRCQAGSEFKHPLSIPVLSGQTGGSSPESASLSRSGGTAHAVGAPRVSPPRHGQPCTWCRARRGRSRCRALSEGPRR